MQQVQGPHLGGSTVGAPAGTEGGSPHVIPQPPSRGPMYPTFRGTSYDPHKGHVGTGYETQRVQAGASYDAQRGSTGLVYDAQRGSTPSTHNTPAGHVSTHRSETQKGPGFYDGQSAPVYDMQRGSGDEVQREKGVTYDASSRGTVGSQGQVATNNLQYQSTPNTRAGNPVHR